MDKKQEEELREHYNYPKNNKKLENYNAKGIGKNPENFGEVVMYLQVGEDEKIEEIGFESKGCPTIAFNGSVFTETVKGETLSEGLDVANELLQHLKDNPIPDGDCPQMVLQAYIAAVQNYEEKKVNPTKEECMLYI